VFVEWFQLLRDAEKKQKQKPKNKTIGKKKIRRSIQNNHVAMVF